MKRRIARLGLLGALMVTPCRDQWSRVHIEEKRDGLDGSSLVSDGDSDDVLGDGSVVYDDSDPFIQNLSDLSPDEAWRIVCGEGVVGLV